MRLKIDWASLIVGSKFTVFTLFYFVFEGNFPSTSPRGAYIWRGDLTEGFLCYRFGELIFGGAYTWRGLFRNFTVYLICLLCSLMRYQFDKGRYHVNFISLPMLVLFSLFDVNGVV